MDTALETNKQNNQTTGSGLKKIWPFLLLVIIILSFLVYRNIFQSSTKPTETNKASELTDIISSPLPTPTPAAEISIEPEVLNLKVGNEFNANITIDTLDHSITALKLVLQFQPSFVTVTDIALGDFFVSPTVLTKKIDNVKGTVRLDLGVIKPVKGSGVVAKLTGIALKKTENPTQIVFSTDTAASEVLSNGEANPENILKSYLTQDLIIAP